MKVKLSKCNHVVAWLEIEIFNFRYDRMFVIPEIFRSNGEE